MRVTRADHEVRLGDDGWEAGLLLTVHGAARRPPFAIEHAGGLRFRIRSGERPLAYARVDAWEEIAWLGVRAPALSLAVLPPIAATAMRDAAHAGPSGTGAWWREWMVRAAEALAESDATPLSDGLWALAPVPVIDAKAAPAYPRNPADGLAGPPPAAHGLERVISSPPLHRDDWACGWAERPTPMGAVWPLRAPSIASGSRIAALRKRVGDGTLAPAVLLYASVLGAYVVLDGHDRIAAWLAQGESPRLLALFAARSSGHAQTAAAASVFAHVPDPRAADNLEGALRRAVVTDRTLRTTTRAWPLRGGIAAWRAEVDAELARAAGDARLDPDDVAFLVA